MFRLIRHIGTSWRDEEGQSPSPYALGGWTAFLAGIAIAALAGLALFNSITRMQQFSPDSLTYIDVAQNWAAGRGLAHSAWISYGPRDWAAQPLLSPCTLWAPLYPLAIGMLGWMGMPVWMAALTLPFVGLLLFLAAIYALCRHLYNDTAAWFSVAALSVYGPVYLCARYAWSEMPALACLAWAYWFLLSARENRKARLLVSGVLFGLAFSARYVLFPAVGLGVLMLAWSSCTTKKTPVLSRVALLLIGFGAVAAMAVGHNWLSDGTLLGPARAASQIGFWTNLKHAAYVLCFGAIPAGWTAADPAAAHGWLWAGLGVLCLILAVLDGRLGAVRCAMNTSARCLLPLWGMGYMLMLVVYRSMVEIDPIGPRLLAPGLAFLVPPLIAAAVAWVGPAKRCYRAVLALLIAAAAFQEFQVYLANPPMAFVSHQLDSPRLRWVAQNTTERDLLIGDSTMDIPVYSGFRHTVCLLPKDSQQFLDYPGLKVFLKNHIKDFDRAFVLLRAGIPNTSPGDEAQWKEAFGPFVTDLVFNRLADYPEISPGPEVRRSHVFCIDLKNL